MESGREKYLQENPYTEPDRAELMLESSALDAPEIMSFAVE
jgi:hypothetical protein